MQANKSIKKVILLLVLFLIFIMTGINFYKKKRHRHPEYASQQIENKPTSISNTNSNFFFDFETVEGLSGTENIKVTTAHSGKMACELSGGKEYGPSVLKKIKDISSMPIKKVSASVWVYSLKDNPSVVLTASVVNSKNESVFWDGKSSESATWIQKNKWIKINAGYNLPVEKISPDDIIHINIWNKGKTDIIIDDLEIVYGENAERRGIDAIIDPNAIYEKRFVPQRNKPPFKTIYCEKQDIKNENSTFITPDKKDPLADFSPNDEFLVGNFITDKNNLDEIICIKNGMAAIFEYNPEDHQFMMVLDAAKIEKIVWNDETTKFAGDFNADGKTDLLIVNKKNASWELFDFTNKTWNLILKGSSAINPQWIDAKNKPFVTNLFSKDKNDALTIFNTSNYSILQLNKKTNVFEETSFNLSPNDSGLFNGANNIYVGNFDGSKKQNILKLNTDWRFDFKQIELDTAGFHIINTIDFKGFSNDFNPKYYEFLKIVSGKFISSSKTSLLVMMRNCADNNFDGVHCVQFEDLKTLPNSTQLYNLCKP